MHDHQRPGHVPRFLLVVAGLLYLLGVAADPVVHAADVGGGAGALGAPGATAGDAQSVPPAPADLEDPLCLLCKIAGPLVVPDWGLGEVRMLAAGERIRLPELLVSSPATSETHRARAPPLA